MRSKNPKTVGNLIKAYVRWLLLRGEKRGKNGLVLREDFEENHYVDLKTFLRDCASIPDPGKAMGAG